MWLHPLCWITFSALLSLVSSNVLYEKSRANLFREKCVTAPYPTAYVEQTASCLVKAKNCRQIDFHLNRSNRALNARDRDALRRNGIKDDAYTICIFELESKCPSETTQYGEHCFSIAETEKDCDYPSTSFIPNEDVDIRNAMEFALTVPNVTMANTGLTSNSSGWYREDNKPITYFRWIPQDFKLTDSRAVVLLKSEPGFNGGYLRTVDKSTKLPMLCVSDISNEYKLPPPPPLTTTSTTLPTTTTKRNGNPCPTGWKLFRGMCYMTLSVPGGKTRDELSADCKQTPGGNLATIYSKELDDYLKTISSSCRYIRMGLRCPNVAYDGDRSSCVWDDGTRFGYHAFSPGQPQIGSADRCAYTLDGKWYIYWACSELFSCSTCQVPSV